MKYFIDNIDIKDTYGISVSASVGVLDAPQLKKVTSYSWNEYHGETVDLKNKYYEPRVIELECFLVAESQADFITKVNSFQQMLLSATDLQMLRIEVTETTSLFYMVYMKDAIKIDKVWSANDMIGTFTLKLVEPEPIKKVLKHVKSGQTSQTGVVAQFQITTEKLINIFWGDGEASKDVKGNGSVIAHPYDKNGTYYIVVTGDIDAIETFTIQNVNTSLIYNKI